MDVEPIPGGVIIIPVDPVKRIAPVRASRNSGRSDEPDEPVPEPSPGTGQLVDLYV